MACHVARTYQVLIPATHTHVYRGVYRIMVGSAAAILCGDSIDPQGTTMEDVFRSIITGTRKASHLCKY